MKHAKRDVQTVVAGQPARKDGGRDGCDLTTSRLELPKDHSIEKFRGEGESLSLKVATVPHNSAQWRMSRPEIPKSTAADGCR